MLKQDLERVPQIVSYDPYRWRSDDCLINLNLFAIGNELQKSVEALAILINYSKMKCACCRLDFFWSLNLYFWLFLQLIL